MPRVDPADPARAATIALALPGSQVLRGMLWMAAGGVLLSLMNAVMRVLTLQMEPFQAQFMRYVFGVVVMLPVLLRPNPGRLWPTHLAGHVWRGFAQAGALGLFFLALPHLPLADVTAIMFTTPVFVLVGAALFLGEKVSLARWLAAIVGFLGVIIVVGPHFSSGGAGTWSLVMLGAAPLFAIAFLLTKSLTRHDSNETIVFWQNIMVALVTAPLAFWVWQAMTLQQVGLLGLCGLLGTLAHLCFTKSFSLADISAVQPMRFLDLIWASLLGLVLFGTPPAVSALAGGAVIVVATIWLARRESIEAARQRAA